jgi:hypothetical protein
MSPTGSSSWPAMELDEIATQAPTLLTTSDHDVVILDSATKIKLNSVSLAAGGAKQTYIFIRQGGLTFDAKSSRILICAGGRLFVPETLSKGVVRVEANGSVSQSLTSGVFAEQGKRACTDAGVGDFLTGVPGAAGGVTTSTGAAVGGSIALRTVAIGVGSAAATGVAAYTAASSNTNPPPISPIQP